MKTGKRQEKSCLCLIYFHMGTDFDIAGKACDYMGLWSKGEESDKIPQERWEYSRFLFDWRHNFLELTDAKLSWGQMWEMFAKMGEDGWEMISCSPVSSPMFGHGSGDTNKMLFVLKRRMPAVKKSREG